jgi:hypothetical protein
MVWENNYRSRDFLLWIVIVVLLLISHLFARCFFSFSFSSTMNGWCLRHQRGTCDDFQWPNLIICRLTGCTIIPFSTWCGACRQIMIGLLSVIDYLCFFFSLSWQLKFIIVLFICCLSNQSCLSYPRRLGLARPDNHVRPVCLGQKIYIFSKEWLDCKNKHCLIQAWFFIHMQ